MRLCLFRQTGAIMYPLSPGLRGSESYLPVCKRLGPRLPRQMRFHTEASVTTILYSAVLSLSLCMCTACACILGRVVKKRETLWLTLARYQAFLYSAIIYGLCFYFTFLFFCRRLASVQFRCLHMGCAKSMISQ